jgi:hypothetical protein
MTGRPNLPHTSHEAYRASEPVRISHSNMIADVLDRAPDGLTCEQISLALGGKLDSVQVNRCMKELENSGIAERRLDWEKIELKAGAIVFYESRYNSKGRRMAVWFKCSDKFAHG